MRRAVRKQKPAANGQRRNRRYHMVDNADPETMFFYELPDWLVGAD